MNLNTKAISPVIATILLLSITVVTGTGVYQFLEDYSQNTQELVKSNAVIDGLNTRVIDTNQDRSYIQTSYDNLNISRVILDGNECTNNSGITTSRTLEINLTSCSGSVSSSRPTLTIETEEGVIQLDLNRRDLNLNVETIPQDCELDGVTVLHDESRVFYEPPFCSSSASQIRNCSDGVLDGSSVYNQSCSGGPLMP